MAMQGTTKAEAVRAPAPHRWTRRQYEQMVEAGILDEDDRVELIDGEIVATSPVSPERATGICLIIEALRSAYLEGFLIRPRGPLAFDPDSEPEPDIAVVEGHHMDYFNHHPTSAILVIEVADASLLKERTQKARLYARHQIPKYWILNLGDECLEVYRDPTGETYQTKLTLHRGDSITPPKGTNAIEVADVLP